MNNVYTWKRFVTVLVVILAAVDLLYLNIWVLKQPKPPFPNDPVTDLSLNKTPDNIVDIGKTIPNVIDYQWINEKLKEATSSLSLQVDSLVRVSPAPKVQQSIINSPINEGVKEFYIPLGSSSTKSTEWVDVTGVEAYVAPDNYGQIKEMYFEASMRIPTNNGRVYVRLKNVTDNTSLFESELSTEGSTGGLVSSGRIPVPTTTKLYRVQLKTTLGAEALLDNARIKLFIR
ncbi:MAG: hypothetical protein AAB874_05570 [Patescibacteria group bacterium]